MLHGVRELRMREPVRRHRAHRQQAARELVLALRAALEELEAALDAELDRLVVAGLEVQPRVKLGRTPVAAVQRAAGVHVERAGHRLAVALADHQQEILRHVARQAPKEGAVQVGCGVMLAVGAVVAPGEEVPVLLAGLAAGKPAEDDAGVAHAAALLLDLLALVVVHARQEIVEIAIARVLPVELDAGAQHQAALPELVGLLRGREQHVQRRRALLRGQRRRRRPAGAGAGGESASRRGPVAGVNGTAHSSLG